MGDIYLGIAIVLSLSVGLGFLSYRVGRRRSRWVSVGLIVVAVVALVLNVAFFRHSLWPANFLPFTNLIVLSDPNPELVAILIGAGAALMAGSAARRSVLLVPLAVLCLWASYAPLFRDPPRLRNYWRGGVCRQTSTASCVPAAAATLLALYGIRTSETEMARLCLTTDQGTSVRGLYRGLLLKTQGTPYKVEPFRGTLDDLRGMTSPVILTVRLDPGPGVDPRYHQEWGWAPGVPHSLVFFRWREDGRFEIGDPAVGREFWFGDAMKTLWHGEGVRLVKRG